MTVIADIQAIHTRVATTTANINALLAAGQNAETEATLNTLNSELADLNTLYTNISAELDTLPSKINAKVGFDAGLSADDVEQNISILELLLTCPLADLACQIELILTQIPVLIEGLRLRLIAEIKDILGEEWDETGITVARLGEIRVALETCAPSYTDTCLLELIDDFPEIEEVVRQSLLDGFVNSARIVLESDPNYDISTLAATYKDAIQAAFGVTFSHEPDSAATAWEDEFVAVHFVRLGLEATARAFERWVQERTNIRVTCYSLFRHITRGIHLYNSGEERDNFAQTSGNTITVYRRPGQNRQAVMTPNNLIHELGHFISRSSGYGTALLGSIEQAVDPAYLENSPADGYTRDGMGTLYLRQGITPGDYSTFYYEYADIVNDNGQAVFSKRDSDSDDLSPDNYLLFDLFGTNFDLWVSPYNIYLIYGQTARVDIFVQNWPSSEETNDVKLPEIVADAFLNWVRGSFLIAGPTGVKWNDFFEQNIGKFLRNTTVYRGGMKDHYIANGIIRAAQTASRVLSTDPSPYPHFFPDENDQTGRLDTIVSYGLTESMIYGWWEGTPSNYTWLLVDSTINEGERLAWVVSPGMIIDEQNDLVDGSPPQGNRVDDYTVLSPGRQFLSSDICTLLGKLIADCTT